VLKDSETFTLRKNGAVAGLRWWMPGIIRTISNNMLTMDEPDHTRLRELVDEAFRRRAILEMEPRIRAIADELADALFADGSTADLVDGYALAPAASRRSRISAMSSERNFSKTCSRFLNSSLRLSPPRFAAYGMPMCEAAR
jgi:hypothetical protein